MVRIGHICFEIGDGHRVCVPLFAAALEVPPIGPGGGKPQPDPWRLDRKALPAIRDLATLGALEILARDLSDDLRGRVNEAIDHAQRLAIGYLPDGLEFVQERAPARAADPC